MIGDKLGWIAAIGAALFLAGFGYNVLVSWTVRNGYDEGYTALLVVGGVLFTLMGVAVIDWRAALLAFGAFACSGFWMIVGSWWRHVHARKNGQLAILDETRRK